MRKLIAEPQQIDTSDPIVAQWMADCGLATAPVKIKLTGASLADVQLQCNRLWKVYGSLIHFGRPEHNRVGDEWVVFGTLLA